MEDNTEMYYHPRKNNFNKNIVVLTINRVLTKIVRK